MKTQMAITTVAIFLFLSFDAWAQHDLVKDGNPVTGMTTEQANKNSTHENKARKRIKPTEVPPLLQNTLGQNEFEGWEEGDLYYDHQSGHYTIEMDTIHHYLFDEDGNRIDPTRDDITQTIPERDTVTIGRDY